MATSRVSQLPCGCVGVGVMGTRGRDAGITPLNILRLTSPGPGSRRCQVAEAQGGTPYRRSTLSPRSCGPAREGFPGCARPGNRRPSTCDDLGAEASIRRDGGGRGETLRWRRLAGLRKFSQIVHLFVMRSTREGRCLVHVADRGGMPRGQARMPPMPTIPGGCASLSQPLQASGDVAVLGPVGGDVGVEEVSLTRPTVTSRLGVHRVVASSMETSCFRSRRGRAGRAAREVQSDSPRTVTVVREVWWK